MPHVSRAVLAALLISALPGCSAFEVLTFRAAENSGHVENQKVVVEYVRPSTKLEDTTGMSVAAESDEFFRSGVPDGMLARCGRGRAEDVVPSYERGAYGPFLIAAGTLGVDFVTWLVDERRGRLREDAMHGYGGKLVATSMRLDPQGSPETGFKTECVFLVRDAGEERAAVLAFALHRYGVTDEQGRESGEHAALAFAPAYVRIDRAGAETAAVSEGSPTIDLTGTLTVVAARQGSDGRAVETVTETPFSLTGIEIGTAYVNPDFADVAAAGEGAKPLKAGRGPLFAPLSGPRTVGALSVSVVERGTAASFEDASSFEKAVANALKGAVGSTISARLAE